MLQREDGESHDCDEEGERRERQRDKKRQKKIIERQVSQKRKSVPIGKK